jgi:hypothetical protein
MDGARIHCNAKLVSFLRRNGVVPIFLPAYCPFFNPIEILFGTIKKNMRKLYGKEGAVLLTIHNFKCEVLQVMEGFQEYFMFSYFDHCGYGDAGSFDWQKPFNRVVRAFDSVDDELSDEEEKSEWDDVECE